MIEVCLHSWSEDDFALLRKQNAPELTSHLGGPESERQLLDRHRRYLANAESDGGAMFTVTVPPSPGRVGSVGYWTREWGGSTVYEAGWAVLPEYQGRGIATAAVLAVVERARAWRRHASLHAFPSIDNAASNAVCRRVGFTLVGECDFEYPKGHPMRCHDWRIDLTG